MSKRSPLQPLGSPLQRLRSLRSLQVAVVVAALTLTTVPADADTQRQLDAARDRLRALDGQVNSQTRQVLHLQDRVEDLAGELVEHERRHASVRAQLRRTEQRLLAAHSDLEAARGQMAVRARTIYKYGLGGWLDMMSGSRSLHELTTRVQYTLRLLNRDAQLTEALRDTTSSLDDAQEREEELLIYEAALLRSAGSTHEQLVTTLAAQQEHLGELSRAHSETERLLAELGERLRAEQRARSAREPGRGTPLTFEQWATAFLEELGAPVSRNNLVVLVAWQSAEFTRATWNPLATSYRMPGATAFNSHGVRNYTSLEQGIQATIRTLHLSGHGYEAILESLHADAEPMVTARAVNASNWCRGCTHGQYLTNRIAAVETYYERYASR